MGAAWKGTISFGLVSIPVELRAAVQSDHLSFRMLHAEDLAPVKYERICERDGEPVPWAEIAKGYEYAKGKFVILTDQDFRAAALASSKTIDILDFVRAEEIDPRFFDTPYYVVPARRRGEAERDGAERHERRSLIGTVIERGESRGDEKADRREEQAHRVSAEARLHEDA